jgi:DNA polymerase
MRQIQIQNDFDEWRKAARALLAADVSPDHVVWVEGGLDNALIPGLIGGETIAESGEAERGAKVRVPRAFVDLARTVACHRDPSRWSILYRVLFRLTRGEPHLLELITDDDVRTLASMEKQVRFDAHKMKAFVRFRKVVAPDGSEHFIAYHRSEHHVLKSTAPFFARRFGVMNWSILTPLLSAYWNGNELRFGPGANASEAPRDDELEALWMTYYASTFNPARIKLKAMRKEMPARYWATMPETQLIPELLLRAPRRVEEMMAAKTSEYPTAEPFLPAKLTLPQLREAAAGCRGCPLYERGTQTVFGEGPKDALAVFVGEQPGDQEDLAGRPFVGPAGQLFDSVLERVGIDRRQLYVTNAVKHFKWEPRGKRRIHAKPNAREVQACKPWLVAEIGAIKPPIVVAMGATAAQALLGPTVRITKDRGRPMESQWAPWTMMTVHPSALLRAPDEQMRDQMMAAFTDDMKLIARELKRVNGR